MLSDFLLKYILIGTLSKNITITEIVRSKNIIAACKTYFNVNH